MFNTTGDVIFLLSSSSTVLSILNPWNKTNNTRFRVIYDADHEIVSGNCHTAVEPL
jgi:hypothetical protein